MPGATIPERTHIIPFGVELDRILQPVLEYSADRVILLDYLSEPVPARPDFEEFRKTFDDNGITHEVRDVVIKDPFDALAAVGQVIFDRVEDEVFVNLATGDKRVAIGAMMACMATGVRPYYVAAEHHGSHQGPVPTGVQAIEPVPSYPMECPEEQQLRVMQYVADSDRTTVDGEPYRIKRELITFGEQAALPFLAEYDGDTNKGKFRRLEAHIINPLENKGFIRVEEVGTQRRVFLTTDGRNTLRGFQYMLT